MKFAYRWQAEEKTLTACKQLRVRFEKKVPATPWDMLVLLTQPTPERADMENDGNNQLFELIADAFNKMVQPIHEDVLDLNARLSAQRFLLEQLYANAFLSNPKGFDAFISGAQAQAKKSTRSSPIQGVQLDPSSNKAKRRHFWALAHSAGSRRLFCSDELELGAA